MVMSSAQASIISNWARSPKQAGTSTRPPTVGGLLPCLLLLWFLDAGDKRAPHAQLTGVQKAPRHEVAGSWAPAKQRALWGFNACAELDGRRDADRVRPACL